MWLSADWRTARHFWLIYFSEAGVRAVVGVLPRDIFPFNALTSLFSTCKKIRGGENNVSGLVGMSAETLSQGDVMFSAPPFSALAAVTPVDLGSTDET